MLIKGTSLPANVRIGQGRRQAFLGQGEGAFLRSSACPFFAHLF